MTHPFFFFLSFVASLREHFGHKHPKYSDTLLDYGFYLLNVDNICQSVAIYQVREKWMLEKKKSPFYVLNLKKKKNLAFFLSSSDSARHSTVCVWGQEHPRCHGSRRPGLLLICASVQLGEIRQCSVSFDKTNTSSFSGQLTNFLKHVGCEQPWIKLLHCVQCLT